jgi:carbon storage regulator CsrA
MLVLGRLVDEQVVIDEKIVVTVIRCVNGQCRLGISAPPDMNIRRAELAPIQKGDVQCTPKS